MTLRDAIESIKGLFEAFRAGPAGWLVDVADILILAYLFYQLALLIKGTRAVQMMIGVIFLLGSYWAASALQLVTVQRFLGYLIFWIPFAIIVIFQNTIRRLLTRFGHNPFSQKMQSGLAGAVVHEVVLAASDLASRRVGALIVVEREQGLRNYTETGIPLDAAVSHDLIISIFQHASPLHDGAVVIQEGHIRAAACFLPLAARAPLSKEFGTRHRAALGLSEETDALVVVVSEERGAVSVAFEGRLHKDLDGSALRAFLSERLGLRGRAREARAGAPAAEGATAAAAAAAPENVGGAAADGAAAGVGETSRRAGA